MKSTEKFTTPEKYIESLEAPRRDEIQRLDTFIQNCVPKYERFMQSGMIGYGRYHYKYASGREGDWFRIGLCSRKNYISIYVCAYTEEDYLAELYKSKLPKADIGKSCIRFKKIEDIDLNILKEIFEKIE